MLDLLTSATASVRCVPPTHNCPACTPSRRAWGTNCSKGERGSIRLYRGGGFLARLCCQSQALMEADPHRDKLILQMMGYSLHTETAPLSLLCKNETNKESSVVSAWGVLFMSIPTKMKRNLWFFFSPLKSHALFPFKGIFETVRTCLTLGSTIFARGNIFWITFAVGYIQNRSSC